ncbi:unnamed protein product [Rhizophagus irregularis]|nr:unnamed protein product [Rhizophagus irregularis]CAB5184493.1 unnamed protein product [Rhizophagus irregularis]
MLIANMANENVLIIKRIVPLVLENFCARQRMSKSLSQNMPSFVKSVSENSSPINNVIVDDSSTNTTSTTEVKKIVLLKRNPNNNNVTNNNNSPTNNTVGSSNVVQSYELLPTPNRSGTSSPSLESELTPEQAAHLGEIDFNTGLDGFLLAALKNQKDRLFLLKLDQEMERFIKEKNRTRLEFPPMNSYQRLIVHRVAQYFKLSHVVDTSGKAVVLYKSAETQIPILRFSDLLEQEEEKPEKSVKIMRRQQTHPQGQLRSTGDSDSNSEGERKILTIEEREAAYQKARARIFKDLEQKNGENEQEDTEGSINSSPSVKNSNITTTNDAQNSDSSPSNKPKGNQQQNNKNGNNNKNGKQSQQGNRTVGNNKTSNNKNNGNSAKNRQQQPARVQPFPYNPPMFMKQGRPIPNFPGPPQMMHSGHFSPFFGTPMNMYDVNMLHMQPILPPDMQPHMSNHYMPDWNALGPPYGRPGVRNVWGSESFNGPPQEINGGSSLFNHQQNNPNSFLPPRPAASQNDTNFVQNQAQNNLKHMYPQNPYAQPVSEANHIVASSVSSGDGNSNKSSSTREGNEGINENKMNDRQSEQKRTNRTSFNPQSQQRDVPLFNSVWNNPPDSQVFNQSQTSNEFSVQNVPGMPIIPPHMYPGMIPSPMSGQPSGPRRNNNGNQIFPGPIPQEYVNMQRMVPPPIMGFAPQPTQPNMTTTAPYNKAPVASLPANNAIQVSPVPPTFVSSLPPRPTQPAMSSKVVSPSGNNNSSSMPWSGGSTTRTKQ